jgi:hypothetical protein
MAMRSYIASLQMAGPGARSQTHLFIKVSCENHLGSHDKGIDDVSNAVFRNYNREAPKEQFIRTEITPFKRLDLSDWNFR